MSQLQSTTSPCGVVVTNGARASLMGNQIYHGPVYRAPVYNINIVSGGLFLLCVPLAFYLGTQYAKVDSGERIGSVDLLSFLNSTLGRITYGRQDHLRLTDEECDAETYQRYSLFYNGLSSRYNFSLTPLLNCKRVGDSHAPYLCTFLPGGPHLPCTLILIVRDIE
ncbi:hypothetical protein CPB86DRAFT_238533 [Serendipita vermifera]|nr:hypothetical protein CPB86DRAFT_238533 [Serendipita vermifera]